MNEIVANAAVISATGFTVVFLLPQMVKLIRTRDSQGVSATWPALGFVTNVGWFIYLVNAELWISILAPFVTFVFYAITLWALGRTGRNLRPALWRGVAWAMLIGGTLVVGGWATLGVVLGFSYAVMLAPSVWTAYRTADPSGISPGTWWLGMAEASLWGYYGAFHEDRGILTFATVGVVGSVLMLARYYGTRRRLAEAV